MIRSDVMIRLSPLGRGADLFSVTKTFQLFKHTFNGPCVGVIVQIFVANLEVMNFTY